MLRCSICKNAFYCGPPCQRAAWKEHKLNCSKLPVPLPPVRFAKELELSGELDAEVDLPAGEPPNRKSHATPAVNALEGYTSPPRLVFATTHKLEPIEHVLSSISRLFLMHHVSHLPSADAAASLAKSIDTLPG
ncbi:hypothetical protein RQP46_004909 [Phenoliferia psychrophenolica]